MSETSSTIQSRDYKSATDLVPFDTTQITSKGNYSNPKVGSVCQRVANTAHPPAVAFAMRGREGGITPELSGDKTSAIRAASGGSSRDFIAFDGYNHKASTETHATVSTQTRHQRQLVYHTTQDPIYSEVSPCLRGKARLAVGVRRLTLLECERLQGLPDNHTQIPWRGKPAESCPITHRYKAIGNGFAVPVVRWIGERIQMVEEILQDE